VRSPANRPSSVITAPRREHSRKPDEAYELIEQMYPELPKIELFARQRRNGWDAWGNEVPGDEAVA
jgi:N6-adenosine-specific RNA methylase IME4